MRARRGARARGAPEGPRADPGRARQPADRLWPRRRSRRHGRPDDADAVHDADAREHAREPRHLDQQRLGERRHVVAEQHAAEERRGRDGDRDAAAVRAAGRGARRDGFVARQREEPARRHAAAHAAEGRGRPGVRARAGQHGGRRRGGERERQPRAGEPARGRPDRRRRDRRALGAECDRADERRAAAAAERHGLRHRAADRVRGQFELRPGHRDGARRPHDPARRAGGFRAAGRVHGAPAEPRREPGQGRREGDPERAHRLDRDEPDGHAAKLRGRARQPVGGRQHAARGVAAGAVFERADGGRAAIADPAEAGQRRAEDGDGRRESRRRREGAEHARRDAGGPDVDPAGDEGGRRAARRSGDHLNGSYSPERERPDAALRPRRAGFRRAARAGEAVAAGRREGGRGPVRRDVHADDAQEHARRVARRRAARFAHVEDVHVDARPAARAADVEARDRRGRRADEAAAAQRGAGHGRRHGGRRRRGRARRGGPGCGRFGHVGQRRQPRRDERDGAGLRERGEQRRARRRARLHGRQCADAAAEGRERRAGRRRVRRPPRRPGAGSERDHRHPGALHRGPGRARIGLGQARDPRERRLDELQRVRHQGEQGLDGPHGVGADDRIRERRAAPRRREVPRVRFVRARDDRLCEPAEEQPALRGRAEREPQRRGLRAWAAEGRLRDRPELREEADLDHAADRLTGQGPERPRLPAHSCSLTDRARHPAARGFNVCAKKTANSI
ncbi:putative LigA [Burkholderia diffusa]|nr:putative LigA [Burkholderia diffusa]